MANQSKYNNNKQYFYCISEIYFRKYNIVEIILVKKYIGKVIRTTMVLITGQKGNWTNNIKNDQFIPETDNKTRIQLNK